MAGMKPVFIVLLALVVAVGCGKGKETPPKTRVTGGNNTKPIKVDDNATKPVKELTLEEKVVGEYEIKLDGDNYRIVFLENGKMFHFVNGEKDKTEGTWRVVGKEVHGVGTEKAAYKIDPNGDLTSIAEIDKDGKRKEIPKEEQQTLKKIK